jgi:hypothetical protein
MNDALGRKQAVQHLPFQFKPFSVDPRYVFT